MPDFPDFVARVDRGKIPQLAKYLTRQESYGRRGPDQGFSLHDLHELGTLFGPDFIILQDPDSTDRIFTLDALMKLMNRHDRDNGYEAIGVHRGRRVYFSITLWRRSAKQQGVGLRELLKQVAQYAHSTDNAEISFNSAQGCVPVSMELTPTFMVLIYFLCEEEEEEQQEVAQDS